MSRSLQITSIVLAFLASAGFIWAHLAECWKANSDELQVQPYKICYSLWKVCTLTEGGTVRTCDAAFGKTILEFRLPARLHFARATTISAIILCGLGMFLAAAGGGCSSSLSSYQRKSYRCIAAWMFIFAGLSAVAATSWYAAAIYQERQWYFDTGTPGLQFKFGRGIYLSWGSSILALLSGFCLTCCSEDGCLVLCNMSRVGDSYHKDSNQFIEYKTRYQNAEYI